MWRGQLYLLPDRKGHVKEAANRLDPLKEAQKVQERRRGGWGGKEGTLTCLGQLYVMD